MRLGDANMCQWIMSALYQAMNRCLLGAKPLLKQSPAYCELGHRKNKILIKTLGFCFDKIKSYKIHQRVNCLLPSYARTLFHVMAKKLLKIMFWNISFRRNSMINLLAPGMWVNNFKSAIPGNVFWIKYTSTSFEIALWWIPPNTFGEKSTFVQVMALVPSGNTSLPEPMLSKIYVAIWCH